MQIMRARLLSKKRGRCFPQSIGKQRLWDFGGGLGA
jgi:hypothetical protein